MTHSAAAVGDDGQVPHLLAAAAHGTGTGLGERAIAARTSEVPGFAPLLAELNRYYPLAGHVITADASRTVRAHARFICRELLAHYVFTVKGNRPVLLAELAALNWKRARRHAAGERRHGRREKRNRADGHQRVSSRTCHDLPPQTAAAGRVRSVIVCT